MMGAPVRASRIWNRTTYSVRLIRVTTPTKDRVAEDANRRAWSRAQPKARQDN
jgi:hypothetical protein